MGVSRSRAACGPFTPVSAERSKYRDSKHYSLKEIDESLQREMEQSLVPVQRSKVGQSPALRKVPLTLLVGRHFRPRTTPWQLLRVQSSSSPPAHAYLSSLWENSQHHRTKSNRKNQFTLHNRKKP